MPAHIVKKLQEEILALEYELNNELPKELKRARAMGDLSENAEYTMAKQRQDIVAARLGQLRRRLASLSLINLNNIPTDRIAFGSRVVLYDVDRDTEVKYKLVTSEEADVAKGLISTTSPIGKSLMGKIVAGLVILFAFIAPSIATAGIKAPAKSWDELRVVLDSALKEEFPGGMLKWSWEGDVMHLTGPGAKATIALEDGRLVGRAHLGPPANLMRPVIEKKISAVMKKAVA